MNSSHHPWLVQPLAARLIFGMDRIRCLNISKNHKLKSSFSSDLICLTSSLMPLLRKRLFESITSSIAMSMEFKARTISSLEARTLLLTHQKLSDLLTLWRSNSQIFCLNLTRTTRAKCLCTLSKLTSSSSSITSSKTTTRTILITVHNLCTLSFKDIKTRRHLSRSLRPHKRCSNPTWIMVVRSNN